MKAVCCGLPFLQKKKNELLFFFPSTHQQDSAVSATSKGTALRSGYHVLLHVFNKGGTSAVGLSFLFA